MASEQTASFGDFPSVFEHDYDRATDLLRMFAGLRRLSGSDYLFGDLGFEMLLLLIVAERDRKRLSMKSLAISTATPQSTALRWVDRLVGAGYVERNENPLDRRVAHVALTPNGRDLALTVLRDLG